MKAIADVFFLTRQRVLTCSSCVCVFANLSPLAVDVSNAIGQRVGSQQRGGALRPVHRHQRVLAHQHLAYILGARHPDQRAAQQVGLKHVAVLLPSRCMEAWTLNRGNREVLTKTKKNILTKTEISLYRYHYLWSFTEASTLKTLATLTVKIVVLL